jgi:steroid delta-isomerase-like uncharacterized protein
MLFAMAALLLLTPAPVVAEVQAFEGNKALAEQYFGMVFGKADMEVSNTILAADFQRIDRSHAATPLGKVGAQFLATYLHNTFPDLTYTIDAVAVEGDTVAVCWTARGTQDATFGVLPATHKTITWTGMSFLTVNDGKIVMEMTNLENVSALLGDDGTLRLSPSYAQ